MGTDTQELERRLWEAADELRANSKLRSSEYAMPVLGLIFLRFASGRFAAVQKELREAPGASSRRRIVESQAQYQARGAFYLPENARFGHLLTLPEHENVGRAIDEAMKAIDAGNPELRGVLPKAYTELENATLAAPLRVMAGIPPLRLVLWAGPQPVRTGRLSPRHRHVMVAEPARSQLAPTGTRRPLLYARPLTPGTTPWHANSAPCRRRHSMPTPSSMSPPPFQKYKNQGTNPISGEVGRPAIGECFKVRIRACRTLFPYKSQACPSGAPPVDHHRTAAYTTV